MNNQHQSMLDALNACIAACEHCATACLQEQDVKMMVPCISLDRDCADICALTACWPAARPTPSTCCGSAPKSAASVPKNALSISIGIARSAPPPVNGAKWPDARALRHKQGAAGLLLHQEGPGQRL